MNNREKGKMFLRHCRKHPKDVLRLGKASVLYGVKGVTARAEELAKKEWLKEETRKNRKEKHTCLTKTAPQSTVKNLKKPSSRSINPAKLMLKLRKSTAFLLPPSLTGFESTPRFRWTKTPFSLPSRLKPFSAATLNWKRRISS